MRVNSELSFGSAHAPYQYVLQGLGVRKNRKRGAVLGEPTRATECYGERHDSSCLMNMPLDAEQQN